MHFITAQVEKYEVFDHLEAIVELEEIKIDPLHPEKRVKIGVGLAEEVKQEVIWVLREN